MQPVKLIGFREMSGKYTNHGITGWFVQTQTMKYNNHAIHHSK